MHPVIAKVEPIIIACAEKLHLEIVDIEWVFEHKNRILRILADGPNGLTIDEATALNEAISLALDVEDPIEEAYMLEVSSPGLERELKNNKDLEKSIDKLVHIYLYAPINGVKEMEGTLISFDESSISIVLNKQTWMINRDQISKIRLAVKF